jgi:hypothetical protein
MDDEAAPTPEAIAGLLTALCPAILLLRVSGRAEIGSSTLVRVGHRFLLATAAHNLDDARDEELCLVPSGRTKAAPLPFLRRSVRRRADPTDVAWVELASETVANRGLGFVELSSLGWNGASPRADGRFLVQGYPAERVLATALDGSSLQPMGFVTLAARGSAGELAVLYPPPEADGWPSHPHGISGGGIWSCPAGGDGAWHRTTRLVGIARGWRRHRGTLHGTPIEGWLARLADDLPELRGALRALVT